MTHPRASTLCALLFALPSGLMAQQAAPTPDWSRSGPATTSSPSAIPLQRQRRVQLPPQTPAPTGQPLAPPDAASDDDAVRIAVPEGYRPMPVPPPVGARSDDVQRSQLGEEQMPEARQIALLRKRVAELTRQMDDVLARLVASEQGLASHRHSYSVPNVGLISVEAYESFMARNQRNGQPVPFLSGGSLNRTTTAPVLPQ